MNKYTIAAALLAMNSISLANSSGTEKEASANSVRNFPVIIKNEVIAKNTCRLSFESGKTRDVPCNTQNKGVQAKM